MTQTWHDLLFAHWPIAPEILRPLVPNQLPLDIFEDHGWIGVVPFHMSGIRVRGLPPLPGLSRFPELNVRTYCTVNGKPGVYFFSLDAARRLAVWGARTAFHLPYYYAGMSVSPAGEWIEYISQRKHRPAIFRARYRPCGPAGRSLPDSLEYFLTERYCLYTIFHERIFRCEIHHHPWPLQPAEAQVQTNSMAAAAGITLPGSKPVLHFSRRLDVLVWNLQPT